MESEVLERQMKILEMISEVAEELTHLPQGLEKTITQAEGQIERIEERGKTTETMINELIGSLKTIKPELLKEARAVATEAAQKFSRTLSRERNKSAWKIFTGYLLVLALTTCAVSYFTWKYIVPLAMEQYGEIQRKAYGYDYHQRLLNKMTEKELKTYNALMDTVQKREAKP